MSLWFSFLVLLTAPSARAQELRDGEEPSGGEKELAWRGTSFVFEQSISKNTVFKDAQLSYNPLYLHVYSLRPRWYFTDTLSLRLRQDVIAELTQPDESGPYAEYSVREKVFALDTRLELTDTSIVDLQGTRIGAGGLVRFPLSPASSTWRRVLVTGAKLGASRDFPDALEGLNLGLIGAYLHYFKLTNVGLAETDIQCTPAASVAEGAAANPLYCLAGSSLMSERIDAVVSARLMLTSEIDVSAHFAWVWVLASGLSDAVVDTLGGEVVIPDNSSTHWRYYTDTSLALGYLFADYFHLALGFNALTYQLDPNGTRRNPFLNPDTLISLVATLRLDTLYLQVSGSPASPVADATTHVPF